MYVIKAYNLYPFLDNINFHAPITVSDIWLKRGLSSSLFNEGSPFLNLSFNCSILFGSGKPWLPLSLLTLFCTSCLKNAFILLLNINMDDIVRSKLKEKCYYSIIFISIWTFWLLSYFFHWSPGNIPSFFSFYWFLSTIGYILFSEHFRHQSPVGVKSQTSPNLSCLFNFAHNFLTWIEITVLFNQIHQCTLSVPWKLC